MTTDKIMLAALDRTETGKRTEALRKEGRIPAILYGPGTEPRTISIGVLDFSRVHAKAGENTVVEITLPGGAVENVLIYDVSYHPVSGEVLHVDFYRVRMNEVVEAAIPLVFEGEAPAVRAMGGVLIKALDEVRVSALPADLPHEIVVDISIIVDFDTQIRVADLPLSQGATILDDPTVTVALVEAPRTDAELEALDAKVDADVTKVEGVAKETTASEGGK